MHLWAARAFWDIGGCVAILAAPRDWLPTGAVRDACSVYALFKTSLFRKEKPEPG